MKQFILTIIIVVFIPAIVSAQMDSGSVLSDSLSTISEATGTDEELDIETDVEKGKISSQQNNRRWFFGGGLGFGWGTYEWSLHISPRVGYRVTDYFNVGGGLSYSFFKGRGFLDYKTNIFGVNGFAELYLTRWMFVFVQPEVIYQWWNYSSQSWIDSSTYMQKGHINPIFCMPAGVGFVIPIRRSGIVISLSYDVIQNRYTPYGNSLGCSIGFLFRRR